jgi:hypothetical protein
VTALVALAVAGAGPAAGADAGAERTIFFQSPSHNIACAMVSDGVRCDIRHHSWMSPPKPPSCDVDYGGGLSLTEHGKGHYTCAGDTLLGSGRVLAYGGSRTLGRFRCTSKRSGMRCVNRRNGHGFRLASESVGLF